MPIKSLEQGERSRPDEDAPAVVGSVVIPAYNEAAVIGRCLDALFEGIDPGQLEVVVVSNGCTDDTVGLARRSGHPVRVLDLADGSKGLALRSGDRAATVFPRLYLDADVVLPGTAAVQLLERLRLGAVAARPPAVYDSAASSWPVRCYFRARSRMPAVNQSLWGAGVYGLSAAGRQRFHEFPENAADDLWVDRHFDRDEVTIVGCAPIAVFAPRSTRDLIRTLRRTYRGKADPDPVYRPARGRHQTLPRTLRDLGRYTLRSPAAALDGAIYATFALAGRLARALGPRERWARDESSREL
jgi:glycosyltransferase involved in cell wall biosynthesis